MSNNPYLVPPGDHPATLDLEFDEDGRIAQDLACRRCGYNLRGLELETVCPECRTAVGWSAKGNLLRYANPGWVENLARGSDWLVGAVIMMAVSYCLQFGGTGFDWLYSLATIGVALFGTWMTTAQEHSDDAIDQNWSLRRSARVAGIAALVLALPPMMVFGTTAAVTAWIFRGGAWIVAFVLIVLHLKALALRVPSAGLSRLGTVVLFGYAVPMAFLNLAWPLFVFLLMTGARPTGTWASFVGYGAIAARVTSIAFGLIAIYALIQFRKTMHAQASLARLSWYRYAAHEVEADQSDPTIR